MKKTTVSEIVNALLLDQKSELKASTYADRKRVGTAFAESFGKRKAESIRPSEVKAWILSNPKWKGATTHWGVLLSVKRFFNWAMRDGMIDKNPILGLRLPQGDPRRSTTDEEVQIMLRSTDPCFRRFICFLR